MKLVSFEICFCRRCYKVKIRLENLCYILRMIRVELSNLSNQVFNYISISSNIQFIPQNLKQSIYNTSVQISWNNFHQMADMKTFIHQMAVMKIFIHQMAVMKIFIHQMADMKIFYSLDGRYENSFWISSSSFTIVIQSLARVLSTILAGIIREHKILINPRNRNHCSNDKSDLEILLRNTGWRFACLSKLICCCYLLIKIWSCCYLVIEN